MDDQTTLWNGAAGRAWVEAQVVLDRMFEPFEELLVESVSAAARGAALDVGCGTGSTTFAIARRLGASADVVGVDVSEPMLVAARARAEREGPQVRFIHGDAASHAFEPASFGVFISRFGVMFFEDPVRAFANLRRAARVDAELRFIAWRSAAENPFMTTAERAAAPLLPNLPARRPDAPGQFAFADDRRVARILEESGWGELETRPVDVTCTLSESELAGYVTKLGPVGMLLQQVDEAKRAEVVERVLPAFAPYIHAAEVRFTAACWLVSARAVEGSRGAQYRAPATA